MKFFVLPSLLWFIAIAKGITAEDSQPCRTGYEPCAAKGASSGNPPKIGPDMKDLYTDVVDSVNSAGSEKRALHEIQNLVARDGASNLCCASGMKCLLLKGVKISFCWDRFTTNFYFADGSYGSVTTGEYKQENSDVANLILGNYTLSGGETGNIYGDGASKPNPTTMNLPSQWTSKGVGSAIPGSELGAPATVTVIEGTTRDESTIPATTIAPTTISGVSIPGTTVSESVLSGTTNDPETVTVTQSFQNPTAPSKSEGSSRLIRGQLCSLSATLVLVLCGMLS